MKLSTVICALLSIVILPFSFLYAQEEGDFYIKSQVLEITETTFPIVFGNEIEFQKLLIQTEDGTVLDEVFNDYTPVSVGDVIYVTPGYNPDTETEGHFVREIDRIWSMAVLFVIFAMVYVLISGIRGLRSLIALAVSIAAVWFILIPLVIAGYPVLLVGLGISAAILGIAIFITHGLTVVSLSSYVGSLASIILTTLFATWAVSFARISGLVGDENATISVLYGSTIDLQGLLLTAMIIGILGVLDDVAIMQAAMVREFISDGHYTLREIFFKAMRVGQEHAAALVNTLVLAYTAVALPLLMIILAPVNQYGGEGLPLPLQLSNELFATEFIRSIVGSFGLVITIPLVTALAIVLFKRYPPKPGDHTHHHHHH